MDSAAPLIGIETRAPDPIITLVIYVPITNVGKLET